MKGTEGRTAAVEAGRGGSARVFLLAAVLALCGAFALMSAPAHAAFTYTVDENGPNDEPGQKDLTQHGVDGGSLPTSLDVTWNWDSTGFSGANTGDACAMFDNDDNGFIDFAVCVTIEDDPAVQAITSPRLFTCGDDKVDRCTQPLVQIPNPLSTCTVAITATQPFAAGESTPNDTTATCTIFLADVGGTNARLVNTCSFPSDNPNSDPSDCVLIIRDGFIRIVKNATPNDPSAQFNFFLDGGATPVFTSNGSGTSSIIPVTSTTTHSLTETAPLGWTLTSATCSDGSPVNAIAVGESETVTCTFNNTFQKQTPIVTTKIHSGSNHSADVQNSTIPLGSSVHDEATVAGVSGFPTPTGTVDFTFYTTGDCTTGGTASGTDVALASGVAHPSSTQGPLGAGSYSFKAHYDGDSVYNAGDGPCETVTVGKADATATTEIHLGTDHSTDVQNTTIPLGSSIHDKASVTGVTGIPVGGNVSFTFYSNDSCAGTGTSAGTVAVSGGVAHPSNSQGPLGAGSYSFKATYNGDSNYNSDEAPCEKVAVDKASTSTATEVHLGTAHDDVTGQTKPLGSSFHDKATVSSTNSSLTITGTVTYELFINDECTGTAQSSETVAVGTESSSAGPLAAGDYSYLVTYNGDANFGGSTATCEPFHVAKADTTTATEVHLGTAHDDVTGETKPLGSSFHDQATVSGGVTGFAIGGTLTFEFFTNDECSGTAADSETVAVGTESSSTGPLAAGDYSFRATYNGDSNYNSSAESGCEPFHVAKADTSTATEVHLDGAHDDVTGETKPLGSAFHDDATVSSTNSSFTIGGTVKYELFTNDECTGTAQSSETVAVGTESSSTGPLGAGDYSYLVTYSGDSNFSGSTAACEPFHVAKADTSTATEVHLDGAHDDVTGETQPLGSAFHDEATVSSTNSSFTIGGTVTYKLFASDECTGTEVTSETVAVGSESLSTGPLAAGDYGYLVTYSGDADYNGSTAVCEPFHVAKADTSTATEVHLDGAHDDVTGETQPLGSAFHDDATVSSTNNSFMISGTVTYELFTNDECSGTAQSSETVAVGTESSSTGSLAAGDYSYLVTYNGDSNFDGSTAACEPFHVGKADTTTATEVHLGSAHDDVTGQTKPLGSSFHDEATVSSTNSSFTIGGTVTFKFFTNDECTGTPQSTETVPVGTESSATGPLAAGDYSFSATYNGNSNFNGSTAACEPFHVAKADTSTATEVHLNGAHTDITGQTKPLGSAFHDKATVSSANNSFSVTGTVTYKRFDNDDCSGTPVTTETVAVGSESSSTGPLPAGDYGYLVTYNGSSNFNGSTAACEPFHVAKATPTVTTDIHKNGDHDTSVTSVPLGSNVHDKASLSGQVGTFAIGGNVTFTFFANNSCQGTGTSAGTVAISGGVAHPSASQGALAAGGYSFRANYNGNGNYNAATSPCEPLTVQKATPTVATDIHKNGNHTTSVTSVPAGSVVHDQANVGGQVGGFGIGGNVTFTFFTNDGCQGTGTGAGTVAVALGVAHPSTSQGPLAAGGYSFRAQYNGNGNYSAATSPCEPLSVYTITTHLTATTGQSGAKITVAQGSTVSDVATLGNAPPNAGGSVTYKVYSDSACTALVQTAGTKPVGSGNVAGASDPVVFNQVGTFYWVAFYSGNGSIAGGASKCGDEVVTVVTPKPPRTPGYWKNHEPKTTALLPIALGNYVVDTFSKATAVFGNMNCGSSHPNSAVGCLAGHLLASELNVKAMASPCIQPVIDKTDAFLRGQTVTYAGITATGVNYVGPAGAYTLTDAQRNLAIALKSALDKYNNGGGC